MNLTVFLIFILSLIIWGEETLAGKKYSFAL